MTFSGSSQGTLLITTSKTCVVAFWACCLGCSLLGIRSPLTAPKRLQLAQRPTQGGWAEHWQSGRQGPGLSRLGFPTCTMGVVDGEKAYNGKGMGCAFRNAPQISGLFPCL